MTSDIPKLIAGSCVAVVTCIIALAGTPGLAVAQSLQGEADAATVAVVNVTIVGGNNRTNDTRGTAFLVKRDTWVTAAHVIRDCTAVHVRSGGKWHPARTIKAHLSVDLAVFEARQDDRAEALKLSARNPALGDAAVHIGFAQGVFTLLETRLSAVASVRQAARPEAGLSSGWIWAQPIDEMQAGRRLNGISGGPQLDASGAVQGVTISYADRPVRLTTASISDLQSLLPMAAQYVAPLASSIEGHTADFANRLRINGSVASVTCAATRPL